MHDTLGDLFVYDPRTCLFQFFLVNAKLMVLGLLVSSVIRISELSDVGLKGFCCNLGIS
jgi:hypothetical protein